MRPHAFTPSAHYPSQCFICSRPEGTDLHTPPEPEAVDPLLTRVVNLMNKVEMQQGQINAQALTIAGMAAKIEALDQHLNARDNGLAKRIVGIESRIDGVDRRIEALTGELTSHRVNTADAFGGTDDRINDVWRAVDSVRNQKEVAEVVDRLALKRTIKVGWVNVYWIDLNQRASLGVLCGTREEADRAPGSGTRIACIQIPDIQEGEGL